MAISPRPHQEAILEFIQGTMGISAVPGSGKTWTLSALASKIIREGHLHNGQEILIVTLTNSAVENFSSRINNFLNQDEHRTLLPSFRIRTLHGLAHDIVRERPELVGLDNKFSIIDEREAERIRKNIVSTWIQSHPSILNNYLSDRVDENNINWLMRKNIPDVLESFILSFIRSAKDFQISTNYLLDRLDKIKSDLPLADLGAKMYSDYQRSLAYRGAVDFDDLIRFALIALQTDPELLLRLQQRWPFILEDEAQDSSLLQEKILRLLSNNSGNWVRVGDPNQAIYETFTTANPRFLREFMESCDFQMELPVSGRSTQSIIDLSNHLIQWTQEFHPTREVRDALSPPYIKPTYPDDPQPNPPDHPSEIYIIPTKFTPQSELHQVTQSLLNWLPNHPDETVSVLVPRNNRGFELMNILKNNNIPVVDSLLRSSSTTRYAAGAIGNILRYLGDPGNPHKLATVYKVWRRSDREDPILWSKIEKTAKVLQQCHRVEEFIWPKPGQNWLKRLETESIETIELDSLTTFRGYIQRWHEAVILPVNQIILTLAQDLFDNPNELAIAHKLAILLRQVEFSNPTWKLSEMAGELAVIARNERRFIGFSEDETGFNPENHKGKVVVSTIHKAKGLEWDRVYLISINNYSFPSGLPNDQYLPERWFIRDQLNLDAEGIEQLKIALKNDPHSGYEEGHATQEARLEYVRERIRLMYVGITRAKKELIITWNTGRRGNLSPSVPFIELENFWENRII